MLRVGDGSVVYLALHPVDFRRGIAALSSYAREHLGVLPDSGVVLVFRSRRPGRVKVLFHDGSGMVLVAKWPDRGSFRWPLAAGVGGYFAAFASRVLGAVRCLDAALALRGSRDFESPEAYGRFIAEEVARANTRRRTKIDAERKLTATTPRQTQGSTRIRRHLRRLRAREGVLHRALPARRPSHAGPGLQ